jgi:hypothetical protein
MFHPISQHEENSGRTDRVEAVEHKVRVLVMWSVIER